METNERKHALLSPSAAHRWLNCTASPLLEEQEPDHGSDFAAEGTLAHAMCARRLKSWLGMKHQEEDDEIAALSERYHTGEMDEHVEAYAQFVLENFEAHRKRLRHSTLLVEVKLDFTDFVPEAFGTSDAVIVGDGELEIIDFKYGKGVAIDAKENPQMMIYALGALDRFGDDYDVTTVRMTIFQPRLAALSQWSISAVDLRRWAADVLAPKAREAMAGGKQAPGDWCRFCKVKGRCRSLFSEIDATELAEPALMNDEEIARALAKLPMIKQWMTALEDHALTSALNGTRYHGYKLVEGRSVRRITDAQAAASALEAVGYEHAAIVKPMELRGLTDLERLVGKKKLTTIIGEWIVKPAGKPTLVEETDKRPAIDPADEMFKGVEA